MTRQQLPLDQQLPDDVVTRFRLYQPLLRLWKYKEKHTLTIGMISEFLGIEKNTVLTDFLWCPHWKAHTEDMVEVDTLIDCIDQLLGVKEFKEALLIGAGRLGTSLLKNETIAGSGLKIVAAFDIDPDKVGKILWGIKIQNMDKLPVFVKQMHLKMAMIAATPQNALKAAEAAAEAGIQVIWNFTPTSITEKEGVIVQNTLSALDIDSDYQKILARL